MRDVWIRDQGSAGPWERVGTQEEDALVVKAPQGEGRPTALGDFIKACSWRATVIGDELMPQHLHLDRARELLKRFTYAPGVTIVINPDFGGLYVRITRMVEDSYGHQSGMNPIVFMMPVPEYVLMEHPGPDGELFFLWIAEACQQMERHECQEWCKVDGLMLHDPHSGKDYWREAQVQRKDA